MKLDFNKGDEIEGFEILDIVDLPEIKTSGGCADASACALGIWARHISTGLEAFHVYNDDSENLFGFCFPTIPESSNGAPHILEHSVFCGSEKYPLKDPSLILMQGSLQTFLNAFTAPNRTTYPAASVNEQDYFNLFSVYADAVFHPLLRKETFMQEGWHYTLDKKGKLGVSGVVYNEMKGAYSSFDEYAGEASFRLLMPDTAFAFDAGGDPDEIPTLSLEDLRAFHARYYSPANCKLFLAGNIDTRKQFKFLNEILSCNKGKIIKPSPQLVKPCPWTEERSFTVPAPAGQDSKPTVMLSWLYGDSTDNDVNLELATLAEVLLGHDGSPLTVALLESGLGEDISPVTGILNDFPQSVFTIGLRGVKCGAEKVEALVRQTLEGLVEKGIPREELNAAILNVEFAEREIHRADGPWSLAWMERANRGWVYGNPPWKTLLVEPSLERLKAHLKGDGRYLEKLLKKGILDNKHCARIVVEPDPALLPQKEAAFEKKLANIAADLGTEQKKQLSRDNVELAKHQTESDSPENLAKVPHIGRTQLVIPSEHIPRSLEDAQGIPALCHEIDTNDITYLDLAFPVESLEEDFCLYLPFYSSTAVSVGFSDDKGRLNYAEASSLFAQTVGGFNASLSTGSGGRDWLIFRLRTLDEKIDESLSLVKRMLFGADFSDERRIRDLVLAARNGFDSSLAPAGHVFASDRANRSFSTASRLDEMWRGITQLQFTHALAEMPVKNVIEKLSQMRNNLLSQGCIANITGNAFALKAALMGLGREFAHIGQPVGGLLSPKAPLDRGMGDKPIPEVFASPSLQIGFAALSLPASAYPGPEHCSERVLAHSLSTGRLWEEIRTKGGAYGAYAGVEGLERHFSFSTYRDPAPLKSLQAFSEVLGELSKPGAFSADDADKAVIGCFGRETSPHTPREKGSIDFSRYLYGITEEQRREKLRSIVAMREGDLEDAAKRLGAQSGKGAQVLIASPPLAEAAAKVLGVEVEKLPV